SYQHGVARCANSCYLTACEYGWGDCNYDSDDGCETPVSSDARNCGGCNRPCGAAPNAQATCINAFCSVRCAGGWGDCDLVAQNGCEVNLATDDANCGACGKVCPQGQVCQGSACTCLKCDKQFPNATARCENNQCIFDQCRTG